MKTGTILWLLQHTQRLGRMPRERKHGTHYAAPSESS